MNRSGRRWAICLFLSLGVMPAVMRAQLRPAEITAQEAFELPYRNSGEISVQFGSNSYFGTATYVHRYTGLTAAHLLYDPKKGFATSPAFQPGLYYSDGPMEAIAFFAVLSGYQSAAEVDQNSEPAFAQDMGFFLDYTPSALDDFATFSDDPSLLTAPNEFLDLGYAYKTSRGLALDFVQTGTPFDLTPPGSCQTDAYYIQDGMSGGPIYLNENGAMVLGAVNVAGTDPPDTAESIVRAITPDVTPLVIDAEYVHGFVVGGIIKGAASVKAGSTVLYKAGVKFSDGNVEGGDLPRRYNEIELLAQGSAKHVSITKLGPDRFEVHFDRSLRSGTRINLRMLRDTDPVSAQTPLQTLTVTVE